MDRKRSEDKEEGWSSRESRYNKELEILGEFKKTHKYIKQEKLKGWFMAKDQSLSIKDFRNI